MEQYIWSIAATVITGFLGFFFGRRRQQAETKKIEIEILENALQIINKDVVEPLRESLAIAQDEIKKIRPLFNKLQNAINKIYECSSLPDCPVHTELQKFEGNIRTDAQRKERPDRQHKSKNKGNNKFNCNPQDECDSEHPPG